MPMDVVFDDSLGSPEQRSSGEQTSEEEEFQAQLTVFYPDKDPTTYRLFVGANILGRQSTNVQRDDYRLQQWCEEYSDINVHGIFLESSNVSSKHAVIFVEAWNDCCYAQDLKSRNKTHVMRGGKEKRSFKPGRKYALRNGDILLFGMLQSKITFGTKVERGSMPTNLSGSVSGPSGYTSSRAVSIGQRTVPPGTPGGRSGSLDKCPSLQEWFHLPARGPAVEAQQPEPTPFASMATDMQGWNDDGAGARVPLNMSSKPSFGFGPPIQEAEENTSSDPEPETPRIDKPGRFHSPKLWFEKPNRSPFAGGSSLSPMAEERWEDTSDTTAVPNELPAVAEVHNDAKPLKSGRSSLEMGAETLAQLKSVPLKGSMAGQRPRRGPDSANSAKPGPPEAVKAPNANAGQQGSDPWVPTPPASLTGSITDEDLDPTSGRPVRARHKSPTPKRSRSGRLGSPDRTQPRSKSPRLQRGFDVSQRTSDLTVLATNGSQAITKKQLGMDEIRDAMLDICGDI